KIHMNAKKIMGAVLVALLALTALAGVGAAADGIPTIFVYQTAPGYTGTWINEEDGVTKITFDSEMVIGKNIKEGIYVNATDGKIYISYPTGIVNAANGLIGGTVAAEGEVNFTGATGTNNVAAVGLIFTSPSGVVSTTFSDKDFMQTTDVGPFNLSADVESGLWKVQTYFGKTDLVDNGLPTEFWAGKDVYTFTIAPTDVTITADKDSVVQGNPIKITVTGIPGETYAVKVSGGKLDVYPGQPGVGDSGELDSFEVTTGDNGKITFSVKSDKKGDFTIAVWEIPELGAAAPAEAEAEVEVTVEKGELTAESVEDSYIIGTKMKLTGTNSIGGELDYYIAGTNYDLVKLVESEGKKDGTAWSVTLAFPADADLPDAGTYTIYVTTETNPQYDDNDELKEAITEVPYTTVSVALKQPFLSVTEAPEIVVQGAEAEIKGTAEATKTLAVYLFGTNYFNAATNDDNSKFGAAYKANGVEFIEVKKNAFTITLNESLTESLAAGQYFMVIQHPMYDKLFNIYATADNISVAATEGNALAAGTALFDVKDRQKANAAQALCDELDAQKIDDMYVKLSFIVAAGTSTINPIPAEVAQGTKLTVSGSTNLGEGELVTVEMLSTAFAAVPKETVGSASFISLITKTDKDGNWEVTFDTSNLNVDEYTVTAAVEGFDSSSTVKVNVIEGAPDTPDTPDTPDVPDTPDTPDEPTEPETPGFGALAALAGLGAVAVLLLRRE
ncbi:PGF-CTERM sorting domain-containing protein, partial [Methanocorpusculum sp.]|nr:PGF-CTERM sorting domain-containing protein [Methanocorpusculum sp.]